MSTTATFPGGLPRWKGRRSSAPSGSVRATGPIGGPEIIADQQEYFVEVRRGVQQLMAKASTAEAIRQAAPRLAAALRKNPRIGRYVPTDHYFEAHAEKGLLRKWPVARRPP